MSSRCPVTMPARWDFRLLHGRDDWPFNYYAEFALAFLGPSKTRCGPSERHWPFGKQTSMWHAMVHPILHNASYTEGVCWRRRLVLLWGFSGALFLELHICDSICWNATKAENSYFLMPPREVTSLLKFNVHTPSLCPWEMLLFLIATYRRFAASGCAFLNFGYHFRLRFSFSESWERIISIEVGKFVMIMNSQKGALSIRVPVEKWLMVGNITTNMNR